MNECATSNGGCPALSVCVNLPGSSSCSAYIEPSTLTVPSGDPYTSLSPLTLFNTSAGMRVQAQLVLLDQQSLFTGGQLVVTAGTYSAPFLYGCDTSVSGSVTRLSTTVVCKLPAACGSNLRLFLSLNGVVTTASTGAFATCLCARAVFSCLKRLRACA